MINLKTSTKVLFLSTAVAGTLLVNSCIKTEKEAELEKANIENNSYNPFRSPKTMGTLFVLGLCSALASMNNTKKED